MIYLDNAASSWPKPPEVIRSMVECMKEYGANPGRGSHQLSRRAGQALAETRERISRLFHIADPRRIIFTQNATEALNLAIKGFLRPGDHVVSSTLEHNSVRRPLEFMRQQGVKVTYVKADVHGILSVQDILSAITPQTRLVVLTHASNLTGTLLPIEEIGPFVRKRGIRFLVDAAQTAGVFPIDVEAMGIDMLAFTGHKSLYGPQGTGGLYLHPEISLTPLLHGGSGVNSEGADMPAESPERYEAGTRNTAGIAGLSAGLAFIEKEGIDNIRKHEERLTHLLMQELSTIEGVTVAGPPLGVQRAPVVSFRLPGYPSHEAAHILDQYYQIAVRAGIHCAPLAHETLGTMDEGLVRASFGFYNTEEDILALVSAVKDMLAG